MNRIDHLFRKKSGGILSVYYTAGYPELNDTLKLAGFLQEAGVDMIELGMPFSDPLADGPVIQESSHRALENGMSIARLFEQLEGLREKIHIPVLLMGYLNPVLRYDLDRFCEKASSLGIDGLILPDLPLDIYKKEYRDIILSSGLDPVFLVTPQTEESRIREIDRQSRGFLYVVSSAGTTGAREQVRREQEEYFKRLAGMKLTNPLMVGFGISNAATFRAACKHARGAIIGSAFLQTIRDAKNLERAVHEFINPLIHAS